ncbi:argininosuccinate synthase domain-containing protein [Marinicella sp. W31]|uniref:argininosuccinate synthase domain-containing protein n=1 Tax=Marinicella sp. W31 TaxID=3023713 RepID=UPI00375686CE
MTNKTPLVLAYSGGLDTTYCLHTLVEQGFQVHTVFVDTGGHDALALQAIEDKAVALGAYKHHTLNAQQAVWDSFVKPLIWSHARMRNEYPLLCSDRYVIVQLCLQLCDQLNTAHFAHGCTAMGNDQFRFDQTVHSLGDYTIHAPIRDLQDSVDSVRDHELQVLAQHGIQMSQAHQKYSINENMLGVTISGSGIDDFAAPEHDSYVLTQPASAWPKQPLSLSIGFESGVANSLNGVAMSGPQLIQTLNQQLGAYGVGRHIYTGDVSIGIKGRIVFECPAIDALMCAHQALEDTVNSKLQIQFRDTLASRWAELLYQGFYYDPHKHDLEAMLQNSQTHVSGQVTLLTEGGTVLATDVKSPWIVRDADSVYAQSANWSADAALGFIQLTGQSSALVNQIRRQEHSNAG